ncbi:dCTP deaminase domain-containing protein [Cronobacter dublinensis]
MQLDSRDAVRLGYVRDKQGKLLNIGDYNKPSSVDLTVGEILSKDKSGNIIAGVGNTIKPQDSLVIISNEIIHVPPDYVAYVFLKNKLSQKGLLALNTGIIDAGYEGPISTVIINFSNVDAVIPSGITKEDKEFFRVVFHKINSATQLVNPALQLPSYSQQKYDIYKNEKMNSLTKLPKTFLEPMFLKKTIQDELYDKLSQFSMGRLAFLVTMIGVLLGLLPLAKDVYFEWKYDPKGTIESQKENEIKIEILEKDVERLKEQIHTFESRSNKQTLDLPPNNRNEGS